MRGQPKEELRRVASRIKSARALTTLNQIEFCDKYNLSLGALKTWESARFSPTPKNLTEFCQALSKEGVIGGSKEWFIAGTGQSPTVLRSGESVFKQPTKGVNELEKKAVQEEINCFKKTQESLGRTAVVVEVADEEMQPNFELGDYVGGCIIEGTAKIKELAGQICLVETKEDAFALRRLLFDGTRFLLQSNLLNKMPVPLLNFTKIAPVVWQRRVSCDVL